MLIDYDCSSWSFVFVLAGVFAFDCVDGGLEAKRREMTRNMHGNKNIANDVYSNGGVSEWWKCLYDFLIKIRDGADIGAGNTIIKIVDNHESYEGRRYKDCQQNRHAEAAEKRCVSLSNSPRWRSSSLCVTFPLLLLAHSVSVEYHAGCESVMNETIRGN